MKYADFIAEYLKSQGINIVFDFTGGMIASLEDSISRLSGIDCLPVRHEQAAGFAAEGYSRTSQNFGVAISTSGPGATNMITAISSCYFDSTPALFITGQVNSRDLRSSIDIRQNGFQELDVVQMVGGVTKYSKLVLDPEDILYELEKSLFFMKSNRPGPVLLDLPFNVQFSEMENEPVKKFLGTEEHKMLLSQENISLPDISFLSTLLEESKSPVVIFGNGIKTSRTRDKLKNFLNNNHLPSVSSLLGLGELASDFNNYLGLIGSYGNRAANIAVANADLIIVLGSRLDLRQTGNPAEFANKAKIIHIDIDNFSKKEIFNDYLFVRADLDEFFDSQAALNTARKNNWLAFVVSVKKAFTDNYLEGNGFCNPNLFFEAFSAIAPDDSIVIGDVGQNQMWLAQSWKIKDGQNLMFSGGMGAMGFSLPTAIGAYCADKSKSVFSFMGDGGLQINLQELETIKHNNFPIKIIVLNNSSLGMVREFQDQWFNKHHQSTVIGYSCPDIEKLANAYGIKYYRIDKSDSTEVYGDIINYQGPVICEVVISPESSLYPKIVYGESIENQAPFLTDEKKEELAALKAKLLG